MESRFLEVAGELRRHGRCDANCIRQGYKVSQLAGSRDQSELPANSMAVPEFAKKLVATMARVIPQLHVFSGGRFQYVSGLLSQPHFCRSLGPRKFTEV